MEPVTDMIPHPFTGVYYTRKELAMELLKKNWGIVLIVLIAVVFGGGYAYFNGPPSSETLIPLVNQEGKAPTTEPKKEVAKTPKEEFDAAAKEALKVPSPEERLLNLEKAMTELAAWANKQSASKEPLVTTGDPRAQQQQPQGGQGYGGQQQASPPVDPNVARFNELAPTRHTRKGDVNFQLNNLHIPESGLNDCERRGGAIVPGPGRYNKQGHYVGKNICSVGAAKPGPY